MVAAADLIRKGRLDVALPFLKEARRRAPKAPSIPLLEGWILLGRGEIAEAGRRFQEARALDPASSEALNGGGMAAWHQGSLESARSLFLSAWRLAPEDPEPANNAASILLAEGKEATARPLLEHVLAKHPRYVPSRINLGVTLARLGRLNEAEAQYREALRLEPENADALYNLQRVRERASRE